MGKLKIYNSIRIRGNKTLIFLPEGCLPPFTIVRNGLATIVATQKLQLGTVSAIPAICCCFSITISVVIAIATNVVVFFFSFFTKWPFLTFLRNMTSYFEFLKFQNTRIS